MPHQIPLLPDWLSRRAADRPHDLALIAGAGANALRWTWRDLDRHAADLAGRLAGLGVTPGARVAALLANGPHYVAAVHALIRLRAVLVPLNVRLAQEEIAWQIRHSGARLLLFDAATARQAQALQDTQAPLPRMQLTVPALRGEGAGAWHDAPPRSLPPGPRLDLSAVQCIVYTSGTSGRPKGALLTYGNHWWNAIGSALNLGLQANDRWLACLPLFHVGGLSILMRSIIYGIPVVLAEDGWPDIAQKRGFDPVAVNAAIDQERVTIISVVGAMVPRLLQTRGDRPFPATFRCLLLGGGPAPRPLLEECARRNVPVVQTYGLTETASQCVTLWPADALRKLGAAGRPLLPNEVRILPDDAGRQQGVAGQADPSDPTDRTESTAEQHQVGEILVRGPSVTAGYLPESGDLAAPQPAADAEGWLHTGDVGYLDEEGFLYVLDRRSDLIVSGGENVYPAQVESVLQGHPAVLEAGVYGLADVRWGQRVAAAIVPRPGVVADEAAILDYCRRHLAVYKVPSQLRIVDALPRNAAGKLLRRELAKRI